MKTFKKVLGVVLAIAMLAGVFSMMASALAPDSAVDLYVSTDKDVYSAGDTITITVSEQTVAEVGNMMIGGGYAIGYQTAAMEPISNSKEALADHGYVGIQAGTDDTISGIMFTSDLESLGDTIDAPFDGVILLQVADDGTDIGALTDKTDLFTFQMKIKADAPDGTYTIGFNQGSYVSCNAYSNDVAMGGIYGYDDDYGYGTTANYGFNTCTFTVGAAATPVVAYSKAQVKMALKDGALDTAAEDPIQLRVTSVITDSDFDTFFANTTEHGTDPAPTANALTSVGIVAYKGAAADFDEATAKALVTDGTAAANYGAAETDYISKASDDADAYFGAIIKGSRADAFASDVTFLGFAKYLDADGAAQVIFYEAAVSKTIDDTTISNYIAHVNG